MTLHERTGIRKLTYSGWHRPSSLSRYMPLATAKTLAAIDLDFVELCPECWQPLALIETACDTASTQRKATRVTEIIASLIGVPAYLVLYTPTPDDEDIAAFRIRRISGWPPPKLYDIEPKQWARFLVTLRETHVCGRAAA